MSGRWLLVFLVAFGTSLPGAADGSEDKRIAQAVSNRDQAKSEKLAGDRFLKAGKRKQAEQAYKKAIGLDESWYEPLEALGNLQFSSKRYLEAIESFKKAISVEPRYTTGYYNIAFAYRKAKKYSQAAEYYRKYLKKKPDDPDAYYGLAATNEAMGNIQAAVDNYLLYAKKETRPSERQYVVKARNKAEQLQKSLGKTKPATTSTASASTPSPSAPSTVATRPSPAPKEKPTSQVDSKTASTSSTAKTATPSVPAETSTRPRTKPEDKVASLLARGDKSMKSKSYTGAMKAYFDAVKLAPNNTEALYKLGQVYKATGNDKAALLKWRKVLSIDPSHADAKRAIEDAKGKDREKPVATIDKPKSTGAATRPSVAPSVATSAKTSPASKASASSASDRVSKLVKEGDAHFKQKSFSRAIASYTHATQLDNRNEEALFKLGMAYALGGNYKVAVFKWERVLQINPNNEAAKRNIERARRKLAPSKLPVEEKKKVEPVAKARTPGKAVAPVKATGFEALMARARQLKKQGDAEGVLKVVDKALRKKEDAGAMLLRGEALVVLRRYAEAKRAFSKAMVLNPNLADPFFGLGETCRLSGDSDRAKYYFRMYVRSKAEDISAAKVQKAKAYLAK